jgi:uncharacterized phage protein (TIGR01671 family)
MSREIKFRVWANSDEGMKMTYLDNCVCDNGLWFASDNHIEEYSNSIMQYTGLKDKNGKEVYERDILTFSDSNRYTDSVKWDESSACFYTRYFTTREWKQAKIIGNIYQTPGLLNQD